MPRVSEPEPWHPATSYRFRVSTMETIMRLFVIAGLFAAFASSSAFAQGSYTHHAFCLQSGSSKECAFDSMAQCLAAKKGNKDTCEPNSAPQNH
jgi:Protein of unknown function (DUF3551)